MGFIGYSLLCADIYQHTVGEPRKIRPLSPCKNRQRMIFQSSQNLPWEASQLRCRYWVTQPAVVLEESSKDLTFGPLCIRSRDDWFWSVFSIQATIRAETFWKTIQTEDALDVARGCLAAPAPGYCTYD